MPTLQKPLARFLPRTERRVAMNTIPRSPDRGHGFIAAFVSAAFLWTLALSVSPQLHERVHPDANRVEHTCAVTFITSGSCDHSPPPLLVATVFPVAQFSAVSELNPIWVQSPFLGASIFEHAPPAYS